MHNLSNGIVTDAKIHQASYKNLHPSYYKVVVFLVPLQGLNAIIFTDAVD